MNQILSMIAALVIGFASASSIPATVTDLDWYEEEIIEEYDDPNVVFVCVEIDTPMSMIRIGNPIRLRCIIEGLDKPYGIQWQHSEDKIIWHDAPCRDEIYEFILDESNAGTYYRVVITHRNR